MSWYDSSSFVILPLKLVAIARALSDESFTGWRFDISRFGVEKCSISRQFLSRVSMFKHGFKFPEVTAGYFTLFGSRGGGGGHFEVKEGHSDCLQIT